MNLFYRKYGEGKPLFILHGLYGMSDNWNQIGKNIAEKGFQVFLPDMRNHGKSFHSNIFDYHSMKNDILHLINKLCLNQVIICGHSMGGKVAMNFALSCPERTEKLIVADMGIKSYPQLNNDILDVLLSVDLNSISTRQQVDEILSQKIKSYSIRQLLMKNLLRKENTFEWKLNVQSIKENYNNIFEEVKSTATFTKPTLFIYGERSDYVEIKDYNSILTIFPNTTFSVVPNAGHWLHADNPDFFTQKVLDFSKN